MLNIVINFKSEQFHLLPSFHGHLLHLQFLTNILQGIGDFYKKYGDFVGWGFGLF